MKIFNIDQVQKSINITKDLEELISSQKAAFIDYSSGLYDVPVPMQFVFPRPRNDWHIKGGYRKGSEHFVVKLAGSSRFGNNGAILEGIITQDALIELGEVLKLGITENVKTIIADFSGIGAQDVVMAEFVLSRLVPN